MIDHTIKSYGRLDVLICNAGISYRSVFENANLDVFEKLFRINFFGSIYSVKYSIPHLAKTNGSIIAMSSLMDLLQRQLDLHMYLQNMRCKVF